MIWALEAQERPERLSCSECSEGMKERYGCGRNSAGVVGQTVFRSTSLHLMGPDKKPSELRECPVGIVLREAPYIYDAINSWQYVDSGALNPLVSPSWLREILRVVGSEKARLHELRDRPNQGAADAEYGRRVLARG